MKLKFKTQAYQSAAVQSVVDCFNGQSPASAEAMSYRIDPAKPGEVWKTCLMGVVSKTPTSLPITFQSFLERRTLRLLA